MWQRCQTFAAVGQNLVHYFDYTRLCCIIHYSVTMSYPVISHDFEVGTRRHHKVEQSKRQRCRDTDCSAAERTTSGSGMFLKIAIQNNTLWYISLQVLAAADSTRLMLYTTFCVLRLKTRKQTEILIDRRAKLWSWRESDTYRLKESLATDFCSWSVPPPFGSIIHVQDSVVWQTRTW